MPKPKPKPRKEPKGRLNVKHHGIKCRKPRLQKCFCPVCKKIFKLRHAVNSHVVLRCHPDFKYHYRYCSKSYVNYASKYKHENSHRVLKHVCKVCKKAFQFKKNLTVHNRWHTGTRLYRCLKYPQFYTTKQAMAYHFNTHQNLKFKCDQCSLTTNTLSTKDGMYMVNIVQVGLPHVG